MSEGDVVCDEGDVVLHFHARVSRLGQDGVAGAARVYLRPDVGRRCVGGDVCKGDNHV